MVAIAAGARTPASHRRRRRQLCQASLLFVGLTLVYHGAGHYWLPGVGVVDSYVDFDKGRTVTRRRPDQLTKRHHTTGEAVPVTPYDGILEGHLTLIKLKIPPNALSTAPTSTKFYTDGIVGTFCHISWDLQAQQPAKVPMFHDLQSASFLCPGTTLELPLHMVVRHAREYDDLSSGSGGSTKFVTDPHTNETLPVTERRDAQVAVPPTAVVFHETRCGSTLVSNLLAAFAPHHTKVYSEAPPPLQALAACGEYSDPDILLDDKEEETEGGMVGTCHADAHTALIRDVFYLMGRVSRPSLPQYVFYKIPSIGVRHIAAFTKAMPDTPWIFAYRDSVEVIMSHFKHYQKGENAPTSLLNRNKKPNCLRHFGEPTEQQPPLLKHVLHQMNLEAATTGNSTTTAAAVAPHRWILDELDMHEYCALHIAALAQAAIHEHERTPITATRPAYLLQGQNADTDVMVPKTESSTETVTPPALPPPHWFVNYDELPYKIWETILPHVLVGHVDQTEIQRMQAVAQVYAKARGDGTRVWKEDSTLKQGKAPPSVQRAAELFLDPVYKRLEDIRRAQVAKANNQG